ncbi:MAG TPA: Ppx/GppA phosphatase family protein [Acidimicrobiales bacterium]|nr:Ppx/GppA phosphatase family protein [Acidimicrobiales bacterium]
MRRDPGPDALAAIDVGTNSIHLVVARPAGNRRFEILEREKEVVRLGSGLADMKTLAPDAILRGVDALRRMRRIADAHGAGIMAVATSAVREATNRDEFLDRARNAAGIDVQVISGAEEARLIHLGVLQAVPAYDRRLLLIDIGGGSTEFLVGQGGEVLSARSLKLGAIRLTERFFTRSRIRSSDVKECRQYLRAFLAPVARDVRRLGFEVAIGSSGTIANIGQMVALGRGASSPSPSNLEFSADELGDVVETILAADTAKARARIPGLDDKRVDIIVGGALLLQQAFGELGIGSMVVSDYALREGVLLDVLQRRDHSSSLHHLSDLRFESVLHLAARFDEDRAHAEQATKLAMELYDQTTDQHRLDATCVEYLEAAGLLHNVGLSISHEAHHKHSYYLIRNAEQLTGFTDREIEIVAQVARYHRKSPPKAKHPEFAALRPGDQDVVRTLAGMLRVAIGLDRTHGSVVRALSCRLEPGDHPRLLITVRVAPGADPSLELYTAAERRGLLEDALGVEVVFESAASSSAA